MKKTLIFLFSLLIFPINIQASNIEQANLAFEQGQFEEAIQHWQIILSQSQQGIIQQIDARLKLAMSYHALGFYERARHILTEMIPIAWTLKNKVPLIQIQMALSDIFLALQNKKVAKTFLKHATILVKKFRHPQLIAQLFNKQGNLLMMSTQIDEAMSMYDKGLQLAEEYHDDLLITKIRLNKTLAIPLRSDIDDTSQAINELENTLHRIQTLPASHFKSFGLIKLSQIPAHLKKEGWDFDEFQNKTVQYILFQTLQAAKKSAQQTGDDRALSYALGFLGQLYEQQQRYPKAISLTRQALFHAQKNNGVMPLPLIQRTSCVTDPLSSSMPEITYRWYWQLARLFKTQNHRNEAIEQYKLAISHLTLVRSRLQNTGYRYKPYKFDEKFAPLYLEFIELLFERAKKEQNRQQNLQLAKNAIELLKEEEIKDYLQLDCLAANDKNLEQLPQNLAVFYPLFIKKKLKLLLSLSNGLFLYDAPILVSNKTLIAQAQDFRHIVSSDKDNYQAFKEESNLLYRSLIKPIEAKLSQNNIDTLIIVPDGVLRTIPFAALYDGEQFLIEKYALVITQGMDLIDTQKPNWKPSHILLNGVSESVQGLEPLPNVKKELENIQAIYPKTYSKFLDASFTKLAFKEQLKNQAYNIIHIASHANFDNKPEKTFLLAHNDKIHLDELKNFIQLRNTDLPLELITLSACETAKGDDKAALGLAGITLQAGAKSAVASLWQVNDQATSQLIAEFYQQLNQGKHKVQAIQTAQRTIMKDYPHPFYWSAFILIGNWL